jgi:hypothetical protein
VAGTTRGSTAALAAEAALETPASVLVLVSLSTLSVAVADVVTPATSIGSGRFTTVGAATVVGSNPTSSPGSLDIRFSRRLSTLKGVIGRVETNQNAVIHSTKPPQPHIQTPKQKST